MYKTFTITITMPMSLYSATKHTVKRMLGENVAALKTWFRDVSIVETPDPTETEGESNITDLTEITGFKG